MTEDDRGFEGTRAEAPAFYSERSHALAIAIHVQSLYSQIEDYSSCCWENAAWGFFVDGRLAPSPPPGRRGERLQ